jgi:hypothetical protein
MRLTRRHQQNIACSEVPFPILLHARAAAGVKPDSRVAVRYRPGGWRCSVGWSFAGSDDRPAVAPRVIAEDGTNAHHIGIPCGIRAREALCYEARRAVTIQVAAGSVTPEGL